MGDKDPPPFGYTFSDFFDGDPAPFDNSQSLLTDTETQSIADFFSNTNPFHLTDSHPFPSATDSTEGYANFNDWPNFVTPATVHGVSSTIPDQSQLSNNFYNDPVFAQSTLPSNHLGNTHDDLQAAETLFNTQSSYNNGGPQSYSSMPSSSRTTNVGDPTPTGLGGKPLVATQHGLINEQLAALLPNHSQNGTIDAQLAAQWASTDLGRRPETNILAPRKPSLKRSYTFGTDDSFNNPSGYSAPHKPESGDHVILHAIRAIHHKAPSNGKTGSPHRHARGSDEASDEEQSEEASSDEDEDQRPAAKKRRKSKALKENSRKKSRKGKISKCCNDDDARKGRASAAQKMQRENLTEEQKRNNHILSEQKRRNLIKRGFDDLHDLVPEIRNGGLSKSSVLTEAGNFLEKIIQDNIAYMRMMGD